MAKKSIHSNPLCDTNKYLFTSESVTMGHPDKVADHISDAILDAMLAQDPKSRVACETLVTTGLVVVAGEITTKAVVDIPTVVRNTIKKIGYTDPAMGFDSYLTFSVGSQPGQCVIPTCFFQLCCYSVCKLDWHRHKCRRFPAGVSEH
ncbi:unnamed protein product [marine sediment metagenome]|uniref:S-adenosylmethionine synthetase N-terminal domain-containing protein n=1 Tax=marine sediment metagenome TaxID=412755 RepID=X1DDT2_9ZZZZ